MKKDVDRMVTERQQLITIQEQVSTERDEALKQCEDIMSQSLSVTSEQTQLAKQRSDLLQERDQARAELRSNTVLLEQVSTNKYCCVKVATINIVLYCNSSEFNDCL